MFFGGLNLFIIFGIIPKKPFKTNSTPFIRGENSFKKLSIFNPILTPTRAAIPRRILSRLSVIKETTF